MNKEILTNYFNLCKKLDPADFSNLIQNIENKNILNNFSNLSSDDLDCIKKLLNHFGNNDQAKQELVSLYNKYYLKKGGDTSKTLSSVTSFFKKNVTVDKVKSVAKSSAKLIGSFLKSSASVVYNYAVNNPKDTMDLIKFIHNNTTDVLLDDIIKDATTKQSIRDGFNKVFVALDGALKAAAAEKDKTKNEQTNIEEKKGGYHNDDEEEDLNNQQYGGQYSDTSDDNSNFDDQIGSRYGDNYNSDNDSEVQYDDEDTSDFDDYQYGGQYDEDYSSNFNDYQQGGNYNDYNDNYNSDKNSNYSEYFDTIE